jgi:hypothetical protein
MVGATGAGLAAMPPTGPPLAVRGGGVAGGGSSGAPPEPPLAAFRPAPNPREKSFSGVVSGTAPDAGLVSPAAGFAIDALNGDAELIPDDRLEPPGMPPAAGMPMPPPGLMRGGAPDPLSGLGVAVAPVAEGGAISLVPSQAVFPKVDGGGF